jgi:GT2 family glycosyltransferase
MPNYIQSDSEKWEQADRSAKRLMSHSLHTGTSDNPSRIDGPSISSVPETAERPFWSVMIPTYNPNLNYLEQSLGSVLEQAPAARHMQIELVDDGSRNFDPQSFLHDIAGSRVSFHRQPQHLGIGGNWNTCLERARGHWVHLLHQDDLVLSGFYRRLRDGIEKEPSVGAAFCHNFVIDSEGRRDFYPSRIKQTTPGVLTDWLEYVFVGLSITTASIVVKRSVYEQLGGFDVTFNYALDWDMWKRIASRRLLWYEPDPLAVTRQHEQSTTRKLMPSGTNIAEIRRSIETSKSYLSAAEAADMASRAQNYYTSYAVTRAVQLLLVARDRRAFLAHLREARKIRSSTAVMKALIRLSLKTLRERTQKRLP